LIKIESEVSTMEKIFKTVKGEKVETQLTSMRLEQPFMGISSDDGPEPHMEPVTQQVSVITHIGPGPTPAVYRLSLTDVAGDPCYVDVTRDWLNKNEATAGGLFIRRPDGPDAGDSFATVMKGALTMDGDVPDNDAVAEEQSLSEDALSRYPLGVGVGHGNGEAVEGGSYIAMEHASAEPAASNEPQAADEPAGAE
jgi:hypothetical protein